MLQSSVTVQFYATVKRSTVTSTFNEETAKGFIGKEIPRRIQKVACLKYEYTVPETGEVIDLSHRDENRSTKDLIIIMRIGFGVIIIEVKDWKLKNYFLNNMSVNHTSCNIQN